MAPDSAERRNGITFSKPEGQNPLTGSGPRLVNAASCSRLAFGPCTSADLSSQRARALEKPPSTSYRSGGHQDNISTCPGCCLRPRLRLQKSAKSQFGTSPLNPRCRALAL
ncbi:hypothetical protein ACFPRL_36255 [Pseudoclavibacter helvolus]